MSGDEPPLRPDETGPASSPPRGLGDAFLLTAMAWLISVMAAAPLLGWAGPVTALGFGAVVGFGGVGTLVARRLPPPIEDRLGLRGLPLAFLGVLALLAVPTAILASELDNVVKALLPGVEPLGSEPASPGSPDAPAPPPEPDESPVEPPAGPTTWVLVEAAIVMVLLRPVVEEFFFRGLILQGLVARFGAAGGIGIAALLSAACEALLVAPSGASVFASVAIQSLFIAALLGVVRVASGSLLAPILLLGGVRGFGGLAVAFADHVPIPGFNAPGSSTPPAFLLPALVATALGLRLVRRWWRDRDAVHVDHEGSGAPPPEGVD